MSTGIIERQDVITEAAPLTEQETDQLITLAASTERITKVRAGRQLSGTSRAFNVNADID